MTQRVRPQPDVLAQELRVVLKVGTRAAKLVYQLDRLPNLLWVCASNVPDGAPWDQAIVVCKAVEQATAELGDGPYGRAAEALFGTSSATRGLLLPTRRRAAAEELDVEAGTLVRHREAAILLDLATTIYAQRTTHAPLNEP